MSLLHFIAVFDLCLFGLLLIAVSVGLVCDFTRMGPKPYTDEIVDATIDAFATDWSNRQLRNWIDHQIAGKPPVKRPKRKANR